MLVNHFSERKDTARRGREGGEVWAVSMSKSGHTLSSPTPPRRLGLALHTA